MSRIPGHPLQELTYSAIWDWGPLAFNLISAFMSVLAFVAFALAARQLRMHDYLAVGLALVFIPVVYLASTSAMDYVWALAFLMLSLYCVTAGRPVAAGILLGAAAGCRLTSVVLIVPYVLMLPGPWRTVARVRAAAQLTVPALLVTGLCYLPVWLTYQSDMPEVFDAAQLPLFIAKRATVDLLGLAGIVALAVVSGIALWRWIAKPAGVAAREIAVTPDRILMAGWALAVTAIVCVYLSLPHEAGYLIPALPFMLLLFARLLTRPLFVGLCAALVISPFILGVYTPGRPNSPQPSPLTIASPIDQSLRIDLLLGPIAADHSARTTAAAFATQVIGASQRLPAHSVVAVGSWLPWVTLSLPPGQAWPEFVSLLGPTELANRLRGRLASLLRAGNQRQDCYNTTAPRRPGGSGTETVVRVWRAAMNVAIPSRRVRETDASEQSQETKAGGGRGISHRPSHCGQQVKRLATPLDPSPRAILDDLQLLQLRFRHNTVHPAALLVVLRQHLVQFADLAHGAGHG